MKLLAAVACLLLLTASAARAQSAAQQPASPPVAQQPAAQAPATPTAPTPKIDPAKEADIRRLLDLTGAKARALDAMNEMESSIRPLLLNALPPGDYRSKLIDLFFAKFHAKFDPQSFVDMAVPLYDKYFTDDDIKGLIQFDQTPLGRKTLDSLPRLQDELQQSARLWGQGMGQECMREVLAEHPELAKAMTDAAKSQQQP